MGGWLSKEPPPPMVLVPPLFDFPPLSARTRSSPSSHAIRDHTVGNTSFGFGIQVENLREASYERADPNFVMLTPSKEHIAESVLWKDRKSPFYQSDVSVGNFDGLPKELRPLGKFL